MYPDLVYEFLTMINESQFRPKLKELEKDGWSDALALAEYEGLIEKPQRRLTAPDHELDWLDRGSIEHRAESAEQENPPFCLTQKGKAELASYRIIARSSTAPQNENDKAKEANNEQSQNQPAETTNHSWSVPQPPSEWEKILGISDSTRRRRVKKGELIVKEITNKSLCIRMDCLASLIGQAKAEQYRGNG